MDLKIIGSSPSLQYMELLKISWKLLREHFSSITILAAVGALPGIYLIQTMPETALESPPFLLILAGALISMLSYMSIIIFIDDVVADREISLAHIFERASARLPLAITTGLLCLLRLFGWFLLLFIPGIIKSVRYSFSLQAVVLREKAHGEAIDYSINLVRGYWWSVVIAGICISLPQFILSLPFAASHPASGSITSLLLGIIQILTTAFWYVGETVLFLALEQLKQPSATIPAMPPPPPTTTVD
ncbi:hypothetical protein [Anaeromusa acidaminophila]|uniref:hypothetical protein n=1 Tax=Anaeromusa acidaminophila TaxID=81464 RepID=UPI00036A187E|nr:hypothetical protein [Anaeromusa acidaminophila]